MPAWQGTATVQFIRGAPLRGRFDVYTMLRLAVAAARRSLYLTTPYVLPHEPLLEDLSRAVQRGVRVVIWARARPTSTWSAA